MIILLFIATINICTINCVHLTIEECECQRARQFAQGYLANKEQSQCGGLALWLQTWVYTTLSLPQLTGHDSSVAQTPRPIPGSISQTMKFCLCQGRSITPRHQICDKETFIEACTTDIVCGTSGKIPWFWAQENDMPWLPEKQESPHFSSYYGGGIMINKYSLITAAITAGAAVTAEKKHFSNSPMIFKSSNLAKMQPSFAWKEQVQQERLR